MNVNNLLFLNIEESFEDNRQVINSYSFTDMSNNIVMKHSFETSWQLDIKLYPPFGNFDEIWRETLKILEENNVVVVHRDCYFDLASFILTCNRNIMHYRDFRHFIEAKFRGFNKICLLEDFYQNDQLQVDLRNENSHPIELYEKIINSNSPDSELYFLYENLTKKLDEIS